MLLSSVCPVMTTDEETAPSALDEYIDDWTPLITLDEHLDHFLDTFNLNSAEPLKGDFQCAKSGNGQHGLIGNDHGLPLMSKDKCAIASRRSKKRKSIEEGTNLKVFVNSVPMLINRAMATGNIEDVVSIITNGFENNCIYNLALTGELMGRQHVVDFHVGLMRTFPDLVAILKEVGTNGDEMVCKYITSFRKPQINELAIVAKHAERNLKSSAEKLQHEERNITMNVRVEQRFRISSTSGLIDRYTFEIVKMVHVSEVIAPSILSEGVESIPVKMLNAMNSSNMIELEHILSSHFEEGCTLMSALGSRVTGRSEIMEHFRTLDSWMPDKMHTVRHVTVIDNVIICDDIASFTMVGAAARLIFPGTTVHMMRKLSAILAPGKALARQTCAGLMMLEVNPSTGLIHDMSMTLRPLDFNKSF